MVCVHFLTPPEGTVLGFSLQGHAGYGEAGQDIVCSAVSSASLRVGEGEMFFRIEPKDEPRCRELLQGFKLHLQSLEEQYPSALRVAYMEI